MTNNQDLMPEQATGIPGADPNEVNLRRQGILVLGMHRSGTSALSGVLAKLGCALPTDLMEPGVGNEKGHWEPQGIVTLNDTLLASGGSHWKDWTRFNPDWYRSPLYPSFLRNARDRLQASFVDEPLFVLKDPRICRLANFWIEAMEAENINPQFVLCLRNPGQIAASLAKRDGMEKDYATLLWLRHILEAESATRGRSRVFCSYNQLLDDWRATTDRISAAFDISWPRKSARTAAEITQFLAPDESWPKIQTAASVPEWAGQAYEIFERWANEGEDETDHAQLDAIMTTFEKAGDIFAGLVLPGAYSLGAGGIKTMREDFEREIEAQRTKIQALELGAAQKQAALDEAIASAAHEAARNADGPDPRVAELENAAQALNAELAALRGALDAQARESRKREEEHDEALQRLGLIESTLRQREEEIEQTRGDLERTRDLITKHEADLADARDRTAQAHLRLEEANNWVFTLAKDRQAAQAEAASLQNRLDATTTQSTKTEMQLDRIKAQLARTEAERAALKAELEALSQQIADAREDLLNAEDEWNASSRSDQLRIAQQQAELSTITGLLFQAEQTLAALETERNHANAERAALLHQIENLQAIHQTDMESHQAHGRSKLSLMAERLHEAEQACAAITAERDQVNAEKAALLHQIEDLRAMVSPTPEAVGRHRKPAETGRDITELVRESTLMTQLLATAEETAALAANHRAWLSEVNAWLVKRPGWWSLLPAEIRRQREQSSLQKQGIFDAVTYLRLYPDVAAAGVNPLHHYIVHGMTEGRKLTR